MSFKKWGQCCIKIHLPNLGALVFGHKEKEVVTCSHHSTGLERMSLHVHAEKIAEMIRNDMTRYEMI